MPPHEHNRAYDGDRVESIGDRHQRRVQQWRDPLDNLKADKPRQHENEQTINECCTHASYPSLLRVPHPYRVLCGRGDFDYLPCATNAGNPNASLTLPFTTSPPCATNVSRMMSSLSAERILPSFTRFCRNAVKFRAYIWLA